MGSLSKEAVAAFENALTVIPDESSAVHKLETTYLSWSNSIAQSGDYEKAISTLNDGQTVLPNSTIFVQPTSDTYVLWADAKRNEQDYEGAASILTEAMQKLQGNEIITGALADLYIEWTDMLVDHGDYDQAERVIEEASDVVPQDKIQEIQKSIQNRIREKEIISGVNTAIADISEELSAEDLESRDKAITEWLISNRETLIALADENDGRYVDPDAGFGVYHLGNETYSYGMYFGDYSGDSRDGKGCWLAFRKDSESDDEMPPYVRYQGSWSGDIPNGDMMAQSGTDIVSGTVEKGLWEGTINCSAILPNEITWTATCHAGILEILNRYGAAGYPCVVGKADDGNFMSTTEANAVVPHGVVDWAESYY